MAKFYLDLIISLGLSVFMLFSSKSSLSKFFHKSELSPTVLKLIRVGGILILIGAISDIALKFLVNI